MSYELQAGEIWTKKEYSKLSSIIKNLPWNMAHPLLYLAVNLGTRKNVKTDMRRLPSLSSEIFDFNTPQPAVAAGPEALPNCALAAQ